MTHLIYDVSQSQIVQWDLTADIIMHTYIAVNYMDIGTINIYIYATKY